MVFLEKKAKIEGNISQTENSILNIVGSTYNFELGPLSLRVSKGPGAELECRVGVSMQQLLIDGVVSPFDLQGRTYVDVQFLPNSTVKFFVLLEFAKLFLFKLDAELKGPLGGNLQNSDCSLGGELQNDVREYIAQQVVEQFKAAKAVANEGLETAEGKVKEAEKAWKAMIKSAEKKVKEARDGWEAYEKKIRSSSQPIINNYLAEISRLQNNIENARKAFESALQDAKTAVEQADRDRGAALAAAKRDVERAKGDMDNGINEAQGALDYAQADLSTTFGNCRRAIDSAQREVRSLQNQINDVKKTIREHENAPWHEFWRKGAIPSLWAIVGGLEVSKTVSSGVLDAARTAMHGTEYLSKEGAVRAARFALDAAKETGRASLSVAQGGLTAADETSRFAVKRANDALTGVKEGTQYVAFQGAIEALEIFKKANKAAFDAAMEAIEALMDCAALAAFTLAKAGLEVAKNSTALLDGAKEALVLAKKATGAMISILQEMVRFGATALNIKTIILTGTLHGVLGTGGEKSRPLSATVEGDLLGNPFNLTLIFNPNDVVAFIDSIFKELWGIVTNSETNGFKVNKTGQKAENQQATSSFSRSAHESQMYRLAPFNVFHGNAYDFTMARKLFVHGRVQPQMPSEAIDDSTSISIPCGPSTGSPILPSRLHETCGSHGKRQSRV
ncbi:hypothetical protein BDZ94DRAFT_1322047 [Collybia nuda]|uniref:Uncharacterized protein n=1 Tax=Collybia nuda TaxID=64659 RepID=A0A9P5Y8K6_9AGAR|nr:hypothetical protein BDZ94DRAFT_1322047 [Collybia nuda]